MPKKFLIILAIVILIGALAAGYSFLNQGDIHPVPAQKQTGLNNNATPAKPDLPSESASTDNGNATATVPNTPAETQPAADINILKSPISDAKSRVTKKPFGIKVSPTNSPVQPEKFSGYHTGVDFEILPGEEDKDVPIYAACDGVVVYKNYVSGYGGVLVEQCKIDNQDVTVLYGHLKLPSIGNKIKDNIKAGDQIAVLGKGYNQETDGERKHLHLGIHKGTSIDLKGYVQNQKDLSGWLDAMQYFSS
jgi:murein DD-endopeptidase MepM/ murein hydrolase activator NlpD